MRFEIPKEKALIKEQRPVKCGPKLLGPVVDEKPVRGQKRKRAAWQGQQRAKELQDLWGNPKNKEHPEKGK